MELVKAGQVRSDRNRTPASCTVNLALPGNKAQPACRSTRRWASRSGAIAGAWSADRGTTYAYCRKAHVYLSVWSSTPHAIIVRPRLSRGCNAGRLASNHKRSDQDSGRVPSNHITPPYLALCIHIHITSHTVVESGFGPDKES